MSLIASVRNYQGETFLPESVKNLFNFLLKLLIKVQKLALQRHVKPGPFTGKELNIFLHFHFTPAQGTSKLIKMVPKILGQ